MYLVFLFKGTSNGEMSGILPPAEGSATNTGTGPQADGPVGDSNSDAKKEWVIVQYKGVNYPGQVLSNDNEGGTEVKVMHLNKLKRWYWPNKIDQLHYVKDDIVSRNINEPKKMNKVGRPTFVFEGRSGVLLV